VPRARGRVTRRRGRVPRLRGRVTRRRGRVTRLRGRVTQRRGRVARSLGRVTQRLRHAYTATVFSRPGARDRALRRRAGGRSAMRIRAAIGPDPPCRGGVEAPTAKGRPSSEISWIAADRSRRADGRIAPAEWNCSAAGRGPFGGSFGARSMARPQARPKARLKARRMARSPARPFDPAGAMPHGAGRPRPTRRPPRRGRSADGPAMRGWAGPIGLLAAACWRRPVAAAGDQPSKRPMQRETLWPPNPKELFRAALIGRCWGSWATKSRSKPSSG